MVRKTVPAVFVLMVLCVLLSLEPASGAVTLLYFRATAQTDSIKLEWETATELNVLGFRVYRSETSFPDGTGDPITAPGAKGSQVTGAPYEYVDSAVTPGVKYYYLLQEVTSAGPNNIAQATAGIGVATDTPTATATATATTRPTLTPTWTVYAYASPTRTPRPAPTATRHYTNTPVSPASALGTPTRAASPPTPIRTPTPSPLPPARVASPTGRVQMATVPVAALPAAVPIPPSPIAVVAPPATATVDISASEDVETPTPLPTKETTPVIFAAETRTGGSATPEGAEQAAGATSQNTSVALVIGGSAIGLVALLVAVLLFLRSRKL